MTTINVKDTSYTSPGDEVAALFRLTIPTRAQARGIFTGPKQALFLRLDGQHVVDSVLFTEEEQYANGIGFIFHNRIVCSVDVSQPGAWAAWQTVKRNQTMARRALRLKHLFDTRDTHFSGVPIPIAVCRAAVEGLERVI